MLVVEHPFLRSNKNSLNQGKTMLCILKKVITATLAMSICGAAGAQTQPGTPDIGKLTNQAMKLSIGISAASAGVAVIGLVIKHHHKKASEKSSPTKEKPNAATTEAPSSPTPPNELTRDRRF
jgi:hypothetical protein